MEPDFIRKALAHPGKVMAKHKNGVIYYLDHACQMQIDGKWVDAVAYHSIKPFGQYCRAISDFKKFVYLYNHTVSGPRG
jgi:hypothetical protein